MPDFVDSRDCRPIKMCRSVGVFVCWCQPLIYMWLISEATEVLSFWEFQFLFRIKWIYTKNGKLSLKNEYNWTVLVDSKNVTNHSIWSLSYSMIRLNSQLYSYDSIIALPFQMNFLTAYITMSSYMMSRSTIESQKEVSAKIPKMI